MTGARRAATACGSPAVDELLASLGGVGAIVEPSLSRSLPLVIAPAIPGADVCNWVTSVREPLDAALRQAGALLFRGFDTTTIEAFARLSDVFIDVHMDYTFALTLRRPITPTIATATELPSHMVISLHGECSAQRDWPMIIMFWCDQPAATGGETPLADSRRVLDRLPVAIRDQFTDLGVRYVRHVRGRSEIERVFGTVSRTGIAEYCARHDYAVTFDGAERVRTERVAPAIVDHPVTGEPGWFNHVETYHLSSLPLAAVRRNLSLEDDVLPLEVSYGDGSPIDNETARRIRLALRAETVTFPWRRGDVLVLDNMLTPHGRRPFTGDRRVFVAMGNSYLDRLGRAEARPEADRRA